MQMAITFMAVVAGLIFSLAVAVLTEELIFGRLMRLFFFQSAVHRGIVRPGVVAKSGQQR